MSMKDIQARLKAPKSQFNSFGKYYYRSCEDIVEAVKPILAEFGYYLNMCDDIVECGGRVYVKATASVMDGSTIIQSSSALAREPETKKGMDDSQITGTASSYARKYALNGLFAIDDTKDADSNEHSGAQQGSASVGDDKPWYNDFDSQKGVMLQKIQSGEQTAAGIIAALSKKFKINTKVREQITNLEKHQ